MSGLAMLSRRRPRLLLLLLSACLLSAEASPAGGFPGRSRARAIRGFKNQALSTARGFGKRAPAPLGAAPLGGSVPPQALLDLLLAPPPPREGTAAAAGTGTGTGTAPGDERESFPAEWIAEEMQNNPELARMIVRKFVDANQDGELTAEELLRP